MTAWTDIITKSAMNFINDENWQEELATSPALFFRAKSEILAVAMPMLYRPPELKEYIQGSVVFPRYDSAEWTSTAQSMEQETVLETGMVGFELVSIVQVVNTGRGYTDCIPYTDFTYDPENGNVTFPIQPGECLQYSIDFFSDGSFADLSPTMFRLFGLAIASVWDERFSRDWLANHMKIHDDTFEVVNESTYMNATQSRKLSSMSALNDELRKYEQDVEYRSIVNGARFARSLF